MRSTRFSMKIASGDCCMAFVADGTGLAQLTDMGSVWGVLVGDLLAVLGGEATS